LSDALRELSERITRGSDDSFSIQPGTDDFSSRRSKRITGLRALIRSGPPQAALPILLDAVRLLELGSDHNVPEMLTAAAAILERHEIPDGPVDGFRWRHHGQVIQEMMPPGAWRLANHLFQSPDHTADYATLAPIVADDHAESMLDSTTCRGHRDRANQYFRRHGISWEISLRGQPTLIPAEY
jgi:hypothetical protein